MHDPLFFLNHQSYGTYNRQLASQYGIAVAVMLAELVEKRHYHMQNNQLINDPKHGDGWFFHTIESVELRTGIHKDEQTSSIKKLISEGFIEIAIFGLPGKRHFRLKDEKILQIFNLSKNISSLRDSAKYHSETRNVECGNSQSPHIIEEPKERTKNNNNNSADVDVFSCLKEISQDDVLHSEKIRITKRYSEARVIQALECINHPGFIHETSYIKSLNAALKGEWSPPPKLKTQDEKIEENKKIARSFFNKINHNIFVTFDVGNKYAEIVFHGAQKSPIVFEFDKINPKIIEKEIENELRKAGILKNP